MSSCDPQSPTRTLDISVGKYPWIHSYPQPMGFPTDMPAGTHGLFVLVSCLSGMFQSPEQYISEGLPPCKNNTQLLLNVTKLNTFRLLQEPASTPARSIFLTKIKTPEILIFSLSQPETN